MKANCRIPLKEWPSYIVWRWKKLIKSLKFGV